MERITLEDVAKYAGVSFKTVSRVVNDEPNVAPQTYKRVKNAIQTLNYVPNSAARNLSRGNAMAIGYVVGLPVNSPFSSMSIDYMLKASTKKGYSLVLFSVEGGITSRVVHAFLGKQVDGLILDTRAAEKKELINQLNRLNTPYVVIHPSFRNGLQKASIVRIDNTIASKQAVDYLIEIGHRSIGFISGEYRPGDGNERLSGYRKALESEGIPFRKEWMYEQSTLPVQIGFNGTQQLLRTYSELTAIFAATDEIATGVINAIWQLGLKIPDDISVVGFDDISNSSMIIPPLTTIRQPIEEISYTSVNILSNLLNNPDTEPVDVVLPTKLIIRDSCKPPRKKEMVNSIEYHNDFLGTRDQ
jgi:LacI family transcriptional regulator